MPYIQTTPDYNTQSNLTDLIFYGGIAILFLAYALYKIMQRRSASKFMDGPLLASNELLDTAGLTGLLQGELGGFKYHLLTNSDGNVMVSVEIGHDTGAHILAFGDKSTLNEGIAEALNRKWLARVELEGDFPDYFQLYCSPAKQVEIREFFNPETMMQFAEFCRSYDFEIFDESLFISQAAHAVAGADQSTLMNEVGEFLRVNANVLKMM